MIPPLRRGQVIAMTSGERDQFLHRERTCRMATVDRQGRPHVSPLWFVWSGGAIWLNSLVRSRRWSSILDHPDCAVVIDAGEHYDELRGVEISGIVQPIGQVPRTREPDAELSVVECMFAAKYRAGEPFSPDGRHAWLRLQPRAIVSWDFRKLDRTKG